MRNIVFVGAAVCLAPAVYAQQPTVAQPNVGLDSGSGTGVGISIPRVSIKSDVSGESVKLTVGSAAETYSDAGLQSITASVTAPLDKDSGSGFLLTDAGLPATLSADVNFTYSFFPGFRKTVDKFRPERDSADVSIRARCNDKYRELPDADRQNKCSGILSDVVDDLRKPDTKVDGNDMRTADQIADVNLKDDKAVKVYDAFYQRQNDAMSSLSYHAFSLSGSLGHDTFKHRDPATLSELKPKKTLFSVMASYGFVPKINQPWGFFAGGEYRRKYKLPEKETRCPVATTALLSITCFNSPYGPPERNTDANIFGAIRYDAGVGKRDTAFGFELKATYDVQDDEWGASLPFYFLRNKEGTLSGGAKVSWDSESDDVSLGLFISTPFDFLKL